MAPSNQQNPPSRQLAPDELAPDQRLGLLRILDANGNRAGEGLRVVEDYLRFILEDAHLARLCKELRHTLQLHINRLGSGQLAARDTAGDVGTAITTSQESHRSDTRQIAVASLKRAEQAVRCLEEYTKPIDASLASQFEQLRYRTYVLGRAVLTTVDSLETLAEARLYLLLDAADSRETFASQLESLAPRVDIVQLRDKRLSDQELLERCRLARSITEAAGVLLIVNDRPDIARLCRADGVHLGQDDLPLREARRIVGPSSLIGVSTHNLQQARQAVMDGANYLGCGPTFPSKTKDFDEFPGPDFLRAVSAEVRLPSFAIGGINHENLASVLEAGFPRVAVGGYITAASDPAGAAETMRNILRERS